MAEQVKVWTRGEWVARGAESGFVMADMYEADESMMVYWRNGFENVHRSRLHEIRRPTEAEIAEAKESGALPPLESLEKLEALDRIAVLSVERNQTIKSRREQHRVDELIRRGFSEQNLCK